jgi:ABC-type branched-subunit amino acid transport system substrate-binding protein
MPVAAVFAMGLSMLAPATVSAQLSWQQIRGRQIFTEGSSPSQTPIEAVLGGGTSRIPARLMPCASCHGADGQGRAEGGVTPSNITWDILKRRLTSSDPLARRRTAYDSKSLRRAISKGIDPAGHELGLTMPRFHMSAADMDSLIAYLRLLGSESDPGLTDSSIRIGTIIPADGPLANTGKSYAGLLAAYFNELNREGGIYGRKIEFTSLGAKGTSSEIAAAAGSFVRDRNIFALLDIVAPGAERDVEDAMQRAGVPAIVTFASGSDEDETSAKSRIFYMLSGLSQQARVLVRFARQHLENPVSSIGVVFPERDQQLAYSVIRECHAQSFAAVVPAKYASLLSDAASVVASLQKEKVNAILFLGEGRELHELLLTAKAAKWSPVIFQPGAFAGSHVFDLPEEFNQRVYFSFPVLPSDMGADGLAEYETLVHEHALNVAQPVLSTAELAAAKVLAEGLRESGRQLSRQKLVDTLSAMYSFNTGLTPPITFGATRRIGALGSYVVKLDLKNKTLLPVDEWMVP